MDRFRALPAKLYRLHDYGDHTLHTLLLARKVLSRVHSHRLVGPELGLVYRIRASSSGYGA